jgi:cobalt/nickel transport system permease protein
VDLDRYLSRESPVHRADPRTKLVVTVAAIVAIAVLPVGAFPAFALAWLALATVAVVARVGALRLLRGSWVALPFALIALPLIFTRPGDILLTLSLGPVGLHVTDAGLRDASSILAKSWLSVQAALLLTWTTPFTAILEALRGLRLPALMVGTVGFMYRYLAVLGEEAGRMNRARAARSAVVSGRGGGRLAWRARVTGSMVGSLFLRSYERSERVHAAMLARGFEGTLLSVEGPRPADRRLLVIAAALGLLAAGAAAAHLWSPRW